ncbi:MAG: glf [Mucilaginibacter sp.]|nr:glf [Mucilaginibacter sp.]
MQKILIVGAGFSGAVMARELAASNRYTILVAEERDHVAGNCHTRRDPETGIMEHVYGPHIFNTSNKVVWDYINRFGEFSPYINRVKAETNSGTYSFPINLHTINQLFHKNFNPREARKFVEELGEKKMGVPANFEEQALTLLGREIYENFLKSYTEKQWGCDPRQLPASVLKRLPVRFNYNDNYYNSQYQGIPTEGYTHIIQNLLNHPNITVKLNSKFTKGHEADFDYVFYTGPIDAYYGFAHGRLGYRTVYFERHVFDGEDYQGNAVINYCHDKVPYTRIHEHKHFMPHEKHPKSLYFKEFSKETQENDIPFYPKSLPHDRDLYGIYRSLALKEEKTSFLGRLATYRYLDMHHVIDEALQLAHKFINRKGDLRTFQKLSDSL